MVLLYVKTKTAEDNLNYNLKNIKLYVPLMNDKFPEFITVYRLRNRPFGFIYYSLIQMLYVK